MHTPRSIQRTYLLLMAGNTLATSLIWGINTIFLLDAGLSNLEAALAGTRLVTTAYGSTQEYFGRWATYCEPTSVRSIAHAIVRTLESAPPGELQRVVRERYDWTRVAEATSRAYVLALEREGAAGSTFSTAS